MHFSTLLCEPLRRYWLCTFWLNHNSHRNHYTQMIDRQKLFFTSWKSEENSFVGRSECAHRSRWFCKTWLKSTARSSRNSRRLQNLFSPHTASIAPTPSSPCTHSHIRRAKTTPGKVDQMKCSIMYHSRLCNVTSFFLSLNFKVSLGKLFPGHERHKIRSQVTRQKPKANKL